MKVGVFVGSFNPPHKGHEKIVNELLNRKIIDKIIIIPTQSYWDKKIDVNINDRIKMLKYLENNDIEVNTSLNNVEYTYQILEELSKTYDDLYLIIGADNIENFDKWNSVDSILKHHVIVVGRNEIDIGHYLNKFDRSRFIVVDDLDYRISSTEIRKLLKNNDYNSLKEIMNDKIIEYIRNNKLYIGEK